ncbi:hypothetical protein V6N13_116194 [Hibiscus sabdariffa]|uniref:Uncharacterized protein n=2 Tax=Hibiscus sabdariffa TaxID=183260 RepID=A0ABR2PBZ1_9ROSI
MVGQLNEPELWCVCPQVDVNVFHFEIEANQMRMEDIVMNDNMGDGSHTDSRYFRAGIIHHNGTARIVRNASDIVLTFMSPNATSIIEERLKNKDEIVGYEEDIIKDLDKIIKA